MKIVSAEIKTVAELISALAHCPINAHVEIEQLGNSPPTQICSPYGEIVQILADDTTVCLVFQQPE